MTLIKRTLAVIMSVIMLLGMLPMTVIAADEEEYEGAEIVASGECGLYVDWKLNSLGTLFLERNGSNAATYDYPYDKSSPFRNDSRIKKIVVGEGVVYLGRMVFRDIPNLTEVVLSEGLQEMEFGVFSGCDLLTELELPASFNKFTTVAPFYESGIKKLTFKGNNLTTNTEPGYAWDRFFTNADIYVPLPFTLDGTVLSSYEEAAQALGHNDNKVYCVNDNATVKWKDYDGTVLETDENAAQGVIPTFDGATPSRPSDPANAYYFTGWTPEPREVTGDMVYTATYGSYGKAPYIDENGEEQETYARPLTGTETELPGGWYVVNQDITYSNELKITGEANLILADGATLNIESGYILNVDETNTLNIYCQKDKSGVLSATTIVAGSVNMYGGNLNVSFMLAAKNVVNIFDGNVNAGYIWAIENGSKIKILGGSVNVEYQLAARENITLGYKNPTDSIYIKNFDDTAPVINIVEGQSFANAADLSQLYSGTAAYADIKDKKLVPYAHNTITYARSLDGTVTGVSEADYGDEITLTVTPNEGYALDELTVTTEDNRNIEVVDNKFIMPATTVTVSATFISTKRYTVKWVIDGEVVETDENIPFGATPEYNGEVPQKAPTAQFTYTFEGWSPAITPVASDITYTAQFGITINSYTVTWVVDGETVETDENVYYGMTPEYTGETPTKPDDAQYTYTFAGWTPEVVAATADATYTATFTATPKANNGANLALEGIIEENIYIDADAYDLGDDAVIKVTYNASTNISETPDPTEETYLVKDLTPFDDPKDEFDGTYKFSFKQAPAQITEDVVVALYENEDAETPVKTITYSVKDYCDTIIATSKDAKLVALCKSILDYGAAAQTAFDYNTDNMAVDEFYNANAIANLESSDIENPVFTGSGIQGGSFACFSTTDMNLYVAQHAVESTGAYIEDDDESAVKVVTKTRGNSKYINISGIEAGNLLKTVTVNTTVGDIQINSQFLVKTILAYSNNATEVTLAKTIYFYAQAADEYFN